MTRMGKQRLRPSLILKHHHQKLLQLSLFLLLAFSALMDLNSQLTLEQVVIWFPVSHWSIRVPAAWTLTAIPVSPENLWDFTLVVVPGIHQTLLDLEMTFLALPIISFWMVCPFVRSVGVDVQQNGFGFVWLPGQLPFYIKDPSNCKIETPESNKIYASRVAENVPFFKSNFQFIPGVAAIPGEEGDHIEEIVHGHDPVRAEEVRAVAPEEPLPLLSDAVVRARAEAVSIEHRLSHFPKHALCDVCNRAKLFSKRVRSHRVPDPESDLPESTQFGAQVAVDHMVVSKASDGKEFLVLIVYDSFSGIINAYPTSSKGSDFVFASLRHFVGHRYKNPDTICRSDAAPELIKAIRDLGWLPETSLPRRWPHNAKCERAIRSFEECCRCLHLQGGFATFPKLWPVTCRYAAVAISISKWEKAFGTEFKGASYALGQLVFYRTKFQNKSKIAPNASPALMAGWKLEFGMRYKGVLTLLDYQALREGKIVIAQAPDREVYARDKIVFPLADLAEKALENFSNPSAESLDPQEPLPVPFVDDETRHKARRVYITCNRIQKIGMTPGCRACYAQSSNHTPECVARHEEAFGREAAESKQHDTDELADLLTTLHQPTRSLNHFRMKSFNPMLIPVMFRQLRKKLRKMFLNVLFQANLKKTKSLLVRLLQESRSLPALPVILQLFCLKKMFKRCFRKLSIRGAWLAASALPPTQKRSSLNLAKENISWSAKMSCLNLLVQRTRILER